MAYTAIDDPEAYFQTVIYTGDGAANNAITLPGDTDMQPDLVWIKNRDATDSHCLFDSVRGATKLISPDATDAESTDTDTLDSFTSDGFQVDADVKVNTSSEDYVAWCWKESATSGFDIVQFTGNETARTISHNLSAVPKMIIIKNPEEAAAEWPVYHAGNPAPSTGRLFLSGTHAMSDNSTFFNDTDPTSSVFSVGTSSDANGNTNSMISYVFADVQGFSKFGVYTGNGDADGTFIPLGFRPAFVIQKRSDATGNWQLIDNKRDTFNPEGTQLIANGNGAEFSEPTFDFLSNGMKISYDYGGYLNASGGTYIYAAFAEAPFVNSKGVPCNAR